MFELLALATGVIMYYMMVSRYQWISILGYFLGVVFVVVISAYLGYWLHTCGPEPVKTWL